MEKEKLGKCQKKNCNGEYMAYKFAGIGHDGHNYYDGRCNKCGDLRCLVSPFSKWYKENHSLTTKIKTNKRRVIV